MGRGESLALQMNQTKIETGAASVVPEGEGFCPSSWVCHNAKSVDLQKPTLAEPIPTLRRTGAEVRFMGICPCWQE